MPTENRSSNTEQMVNVPEGYMLVERSIWTEQQVEAATACITLLKVVPGMRDRDLAMAAIDAAQCKAPDIRLSDLLTAAQPLGWVYEGGQEFTSDPDRAHDLRAEGIELTAVYGLAQHQVEPVAYQWRCKTVHEGSQWRHWVACTEEDYSKTIENPGPTWRGIVREARKLYTHADAGELERLRAALKFYADREHYHFESGNWDTVSGEPLNILWCGDDPDFIEDGSVARAALERKS